ncbi:norbelladine synthase-like [Triticum urartu]|uniref:Bet v I/Major latex protein domain-containing protein n=1 Tax=Triticum urartu TaxID=4572 RepID=A0A8R7PJW6_TRIUA|nr:norbelladine synthase-like [Triticum urartu]
MEGGSLWHELETDLPAADVWEVYGGLAIGRLIPQLLPHVLSKVELVEGDGGVGTILLVTFPPQGDSEPRSYKEKFNVIDNEKYIKEAETIEGGFLDLGFRKHLMRIEIVGKEDGKSVIRSTVEYEVDAEHAKNVSLVSTQALASVAEAITKHIKEQKKSPEQATE